MKRGIRRLIIVAAVLVGLGVAYRENAAAQARLSSCLQAAYSVTSNSGCIESNRPDWAQCLKEAEATTKRMTESCSQMGGLITHVIDPLIFGAFAAVGVALLLELVRFIVTWVIAGFRPRSAS